MLMNDPANLPQILADAQREELPSRAPVKDQEMLESYAEAGLYPNVSPCPVGCKFCYERHLVHYYPNLQVARIRSRSEEQFEFYDEQLKTFDQTALPSAPVFYAEGKVLYHSASDFF